MEARLTSYQGESCIEQIPKMRAMTLEGLQDFLDIHHSTWADWRDDKHDLSAIVTRAERVIRRQKFEGAAADLLNANIIARDLGLAEKSKVDADVNMNEPTGAKEKLANLITKAASA